MRLHLSTWPEVETYLADRQSIILPIGSTEQHSPCGLIGTDAITAETIAGEVGTRTGTLVGPTIPVGMAHHHMAFPGSMTLRPSTLIALIRDYVVSLSSHGFRSVLFINGHGGNIPSVQSAFYEVYETLRVQQGDAAPALRLALCNWFTLPSVGALAKELYGDHEGWHATPSEVAVTWAAYPDHIKTAPLEPLDPVDPRFYDSRDFRARFPDGRMGSDPSLAKPEHGHRFIDAVSTEIVARHGAFLDGA
ncbi:creatininase family protein [Roseospira marina]|uniref:Creatininase family protein n=1 Tax=Roseospira marina TaxID=140057 RepID=A0A5M6IEJ4_9PROT|nr:creatininase family protein [Roseospira marina]KAA5606700.1 creatininase family protein [Roseospira marina]MBB4313887.1 creatinine amidohydrolase [Roseospira marina]MBB5087049.1 creatinine amidohydrolase [Roseospira marina]